MGGDQKREESHSGPARVRWPLGDAQQSKKLSREHTSLHAEQCGESKRILVKKRDCIDLTEGEKAELQRFEVDFRARTSFLSRDGCWQ